MHGKYWFYLFICYKMLAMGIDFLFSSLANHPIVLFFVLAFIGGEESIIPLAIIVGGGRWDIKTLFVVSFVSTMCADLTWFLLGRHGIKEHRLFKRHQNNYNKISLFIRKISKNDFVLLLITKFIYGTRIFSIIYLSLEGVSVTKFFRMNFLVILVWLPVIVGGGFMIGRGSSLFSDIHKHPIYLSISILLLVIAFHFVRSYFSKKFLPSKLQK